MLEVKFNSIKGGPQINNLPVLSKKDGHFIGVVNVYDKIELRNGRNISLMMPEDPDMWLGWGGETDLDTKSANPREIIEFEILTLRFYKGTFGEDGNSIHLLCDPEDWKTYTTRLQIEAK